MAGISRHIIARRPDKTFRTFANANVFRGQTRLFSLAYRHQKAPSEVLALPAGGRLAGHPAAPFDGREKRPDRL